MKMNKKDVYAAIYGQIVADALGVPYEFSSPEEMKDNPATAMTGYGTYNKPVGTWSDDSSLTVSLMDSLSDGVDYDDIMKKYSSWLYDGEYTPEGDTFDVGRTTSVAIENYENGCNPLECGGSDERDNGNGSLMRIMPVILYSIRRNLSLDETRKLIDDVSSITHAHRISKASCNIYNFIVKEILQNRNDDFKNIIRNGVNKSGKYYSKMECFNRIYDETFLDEPTDTIGSTGYVVDSLETALYCCYNTVDYKEAVLMAVNLGGDTDTNAMITGGLAALYYGYESIPPEWTDTIINRELIDSVINKFCEKLEIR